MREKRLVVLNEIDNRAKLIAAKSLNGDVITEDILKIIIELYSSAQVEQVLVDDYFEAAYHAPITGELEFFIARVLYHVSINNKKNWKILLRKQEASTAPDIRILKDGITIAIIEIKAKGGWMQPFLSSERYAKDKENHEGGYKFDPDALINNQRAQLNKYMTVHGIEKKNLFFLLPTLALVHRKKYTSTMEDYYSYFTTTSLLPKQNFILLSENKRLDLAKKPNILQLEPTNRFENMISTLLVIYR